MKHAYFVSDNLDELEVVHDELVKEGLADSHIHVWSSQEMEVENHNLRNVNPIKKTDMFPSMLKGAALGAVLGALVLSIPLFYATPESLGLAPFVFASVALFGFCIWEAGLLGIHFANRRFEQVLKDGRHLLILDYADKQAASVKNRLSAHPNISAVSL